MSDVISFEKKISNDKHTLFKEIKSWIFKKKGRIIKENDSSYIYAINYLDIWNFSSAGNSIEIILEEVDGKTNIKIVVPMIIVSSFMLFLKAHNMVYMMIIEDFFNYIGSKLSKEELTLLYPKDYIISMLIASVFYSILFLLFTLIGFIGMLDFFPDLIFIIFVIMSFTMLWLAYPHFRSLFKTISLLSIL